MLGAGRYFNYINETIVKRGLKPVHPMTTIDLVRQFGSEIPEKTDCQKLEYFSTVVENFNKYGLKQDN